MTSGVKLAGRQYGLLYGTREVAGALLTEKESAVHGWYEPAVAD
jgi:hypothetical protein